jgi:hypothetical protein
VAARMPDPSRLPQPGWRLIGFASIGLGSGLYTADVPFIVLAAAFVPAVIALVMIAAKATSGSPVPAEAPAADENSQPR